MDENKNTDEDKKMDEQHNIIDIVELKFIKNSKVCANNDSLYVYFPKRLRELIEIPRGDSVGWFLDPARGWIILKKSEFMEGGFPLKTVQDAKEAEEEKNG